MKILSKSLFYFLSFVTLLQLSLFSCKSDDDTPRTNPPTINISEGNIDFVKTLGGSKNESGQSVTNTLDGGYAILGYTQSMDFDISGKDNESFDFWVLKYNSEDILEWSKTYGGTNDERGNEIIQTQDGGYAIIGFTYSTDGDVTTNAGQEDFWFVKLDSSGNIQWQKTYGYSGIDTGISVMQTNDGGYFLTGILDVTASGGEGNTRLSQTQHAGGDYWTIKTDANGNMQWSRYFGGFFSDSAFDAVQTQDNGFMIIGSSDSIDTDITNNKGSYDFWIVKISNNGTLQWEKSFGGSGIDEARAAITTSEGDVVIIGDTRSDDIDVNNYIGAADVWVIKVSPEGELLWEKTVGGISFDVGRSVSKTSDNGFIISGSSRSSDGDILQNNGQNDALVIKIDTTGNLVWEQTIGGTDIDFSYGVTQLNDGKIIAVGDTSSNDLDITENKGFSDLLIIKIK